MGVRLKAFLKAYKERGGVIRFKLIMYFSFSNFMNWFIAFSGADELNVWDLAWRLKHWNLSNKIISFWDVTFISLIIVKEAFVLRGFDFSADMLCHFGQIMYYFGPLSSLIKWRVVLNYKILASGLVEYT